MYKSIDTRDYYVGIDLGGTNIAAAIVDEYGTIYGRSTRKTNAPRPYEEIFSDMAECAKEAAIESCNRKRTFL